MGSYKEQGRGMADQLKGTVKESIGRATNDPQLEDEGRMDKDMGRTRTDVARGAERIKGAAEEMKGSLKKNVGDMVDNERMESEGTLDKAKGKLRRKLNE